MPSVQNATYGISPAQGLRGCAEQEVVLTPDACMPARHRTRLFMRMQVACTALTHEPYSTIVACVPAIDLPPPTTHMHRVQITKSYSTRAPASCSAVHQLPHLRTHIRPKPTTITTCSNVPIAQQAADRSRLPAIYLSSSSSCSLLSPERWAAGTPCGTP